MRIGAKGKHKKDENCQWWYYAPSGNYRKRVYERKCSICGEKSLVDKVHLEDRCQSCAARNNMENYNNSRDCKEYYITNHGYIKIKCPKHPYKDRDGFVFEHRLVMEDIVGRFLEKEEVVHHINEKRDDNRRSNLWLFSTNSDHSKYHNNIDKIGNVTLNIYLAGSISKDKATYEWREELAFLCRDIVLWRKAYFLDPCRNLFNQELIRENCENNIDFMRLAVERSQHLLRPKDYQMIKSSQIMIVHIGFYSKDKPLIGTLHEITWAKDIFKIPIIAITNGEKNPYVVHPWMDECCSAMVNSVEEAASILKQFFLVY